MPKVDLSKMKAALQTAFKEKFTPGYYHGTREPDITAFDPSKSSKPEELVTPGVTFVTKDINFAHDYTPTRGTASQMHGQPDQYVTGATIYPLSVNEGKKFNFDTPEGRAIVKAFLKDKMIPEMGEKKAAKWLEAMQDELNNWKGMEHPDFLKHLQETGHDSFVVKEAGINNLGVFKPENIRGKFAKFNPDEAASTEFMKAEGGLIDHLAGGGIPEKIVKAYKLFKTKPNAPGELFPLFVNANESVPIGKWIEATEGPLTQAGKVKSSIGDLAYRPGWHAGDVPAATHIGGKSSPDLKAPDFRPADQVWAEVEMPADVDWQKIALERALRNKAGEVIPRTAHITDQLPIGGHYRYKTNPNMTGDWLIGGSMKVNKVLTDEEVRAINEAKGIFDLPRYEPFKKAEGGSIPHMAGGGDLIKALGKKINFTHFSHQPNLSTLEPAMYGKGIKGAESTRLESAPDIKPRSYFYHGENIVPEQGLGPHRYTGVSEFSYPLMEDPEQFRKAAKKAAIDPYFAKMGVEIVDPNTRLNTLERLIKEAGYTGYHTDDAGILFNRTPVSKVTE